MVGDLEAHLLAGAHGKEGGEAVDEGDLAAHGKARRRRHRVGLGDAHLEEAIREFEVERDGVLAEVRLFAKAKFAFEAAQAAPIGYYLDQRFKTSWLTPVMALLGMAAGIKEMVRAIKVANRADDEARKQQRDDRGE